MTTVFAVGTALAAGPNPANHALSPSPPRPPAPSPSPFSYLAPTSEACRAHIVSLLHPFPLASSSSSTSSSCLGREAVSSASSSLRFGKVTPSSHHSNCQLDDQSSFSSSSSSPGLPSPSSSWDSSSPPSSSAGVVISSVSSNKKATRLHHHLHRLSGSFVDWTDLCRPFLGGVGVGGGGGGGGGGEEEKLARRRRRAMRIVVPMSRKSDREASGTSPRDSTSSSSSIVSLSPSSSSSAALNAYHSSPRSDVTARFATDDGASTLGLFMPAEEATMGRSCSSEDDEVSEDSAPPSLSPFAGRMSNGSSAGCAFAYSRPSILAVDGAFVAEAPSGTVICNSRGCRPIGNDAYQPFELDRGDEWIRRRDAALHLPRRLAEFHARAERFDEMRGGGGGGVSAGNNGIGSRRHSATGRGGAVGVHHSSSAVSPVKQFAGEFAQYCGEFCEIELAEKYYREAIEASPTDSKLLADYATFAWRRLKDKAKAEQLFNRALEEAPDCAEVLASYALFLWQLES
ncbi:hypothetical protein CBR_g19742 [Chara braunii]|uniref:Uncharacterized protein n=1 Tax=Chara braunii TaxID=69332 RepID=A0A388JTR9_CHABU|nr:hypothetical protein CBR_g19742 [Chara braunii]|eukprot:GBG61209.1 hypothetical protein CBR_g19742 [Chara braunii]